MSAESRPRAWPARLAQGYALLFLVLLAGGVFLGLPGRSGVHRSALIPGATALFAPAGALLILPAALALLRPSLPLFGGRHRIRAGLTALIIGIAFLGVGMARITAGRGWRALACPAILLLGGWLLREQLRGPARSRLCSAAARRGRRVTAWQIYLFGWLFVLLCPVFVAWSLGLSAWR